MSGPDAAEADLPPLSSQTPVVVMSLLVDPVRTMLLNHLALLFRQVGAGEPLILCLDLAGGAMDQRAGGYGEAGETPSLVRSLLGRCGFNLSPWPQTQPPAAGPAPPEAIGSGFWLCERAAQSPRWSLRHVRQSDFASFATLFAQVFGHAISLDLWRWKYADGRGCAIAAWRHDELIAHYGGSLRRVLAFGRPIRALQVCDAMVAPRERAVMTKTGVMFQLTAAFLELYQGLIGIPLAYGFPNKRAMRLGERLGFYAEVGALRELRWPAQGHRPRLDSRVRFVDGDDAADRLAVRQLWEAMAADLADALVGVRDWEFLRQRYVEHPERRYRLVLVRTRLTGTPLGLMILHQEQSRLALTDLVAPLRHIPRLLLQARRLAGLWGCGTLYTWITRQHIGRFRTPDMEEVDIEVSIPTNVWVAQPYSPPQLSDRWWLMLGDTDFL